MLVRCPLAETRRAARKLMRYDMEASRQLDLVEGEASAGVLTSEIVTETSATHQPLFGERSSEPTGHAWTVM